MLPTLLQFFNSFIHFKVAHFNTVFSFQLKGLMGKLFKHAPVDAAVDQLGKRLMFDALPPALEV